VNGNDSLENFCAHSSIVHGAFTIWDMDFNIQGTCRLFFTQRTSMYYKCQRVAFMLCWHIKRDQRLSNPLPLLQQYWWYKMFQIVVEDRMVWVWDRMVWVWEWVDNFYIVHCRDVFIPCIFHVHWVTPHWSDRQPSMRPGMKGWRLWRTVCFTGTVQLRLFTSQFLTDDMRCKMWWYAYYV